MANTDGMQRAFEGEQSLSEANIYVSLIYDELDASKAMARVKSPKAGAVVLFAGT
jgi:molybdopterin synthase catalytic subunit